MTEAEAVRWAGDRPATVESLAADLRALGVEAGGTLCVHSSLSALGWVCGGAQAVVEAILRVLGARGTLVMPTHTGGNSEPSHWVNPPVPEAWWTSIRDTMPPFDPRITPTRAMGVIADCFRSWPGALRSSHPCSSFAARGPRAKEIVSDHGLAYGFGEASPLAKLYHGGASVLLLGVGHDRNSALHLAETRARWPHRREIEAAAAAREDGRRVWAAYRDLDYDSGDFARLGSEYDGPQSQGLVARAQSILVPQRPLVDFAVAWIERNRI